MTTVAGLERRYARLIRIAYPRGYRGHRGAELLGTLMDAAEPDRQWPAARDVLDLARHGLRIRTGLTADAASARTLGLAAPFGVALAAGLSVIALTYGELPVHHVSSATFANKQYGFGPFETTGVVVYACVLLALLCSLSRALRPANWLSWLTILTTAAVHEISAHGGTAAPNLTLLVVIALCMVPLAVAPAAGVPSSTPSRIWEVLVVAALSLLGPLVLWTTPWSGDDARQAFYRDSNGLVPLWTPAIPVLAGLFLVGLGSYALARQRPDVWTAGSLLLAPAAAWSYGGSRIYVFSDGSGSFFGVVGLAAIVLVLHVTVLRSPAVGDRPRPERSAPD